MRSSTRRDFAKATAGTVVLGGLLPGVTAAGAPAAAARCEVRRPGVRRIAVALAPNGRTAWTADASTGTLTAHGVRDAAPKAEVPLPGTPLALALLVGGRRALVALSDDATIVVDLETKRVVARDTPGPHVRFVAVDPAGHTAVVGGGDADGWVRRVDPRTGRPLDDEPIAVGAHPRAVALVGRRKALVACNGAASVAVVDLVKRTVRTIATAPFPAHVVVDGDGRRAWVSHDGYRARTVTPVDLVARKAGKAWRTGADPGGLAVLRGGRVVAVAERGTGRVTLHDARTGRRSGKVSVGGTPRGLVGTGRRALVVDDETGRVTAVAA